MLSTSTPTNRTAAPQPTCDHAGRVAAHCKEGDAVGVSQRGHQPRLALQLANQLQEAGRSNVDKRVDRMERTRRIRGGRSVHKMQGAAARLRQPSTLRAGPPPVRTCCVGKSQQLTAESWAHLLRGLERLLRLPLVVDGAAAQQDFDGHSGFVPGAQVHLHISECARTGWLLSSAKQTQSK